jgi:hypothetical protein
MGLTFLFCFLSFGAFAKDQIPQVDDGNNQTFWRQIPSVSRLGPTNRSNDFVRIENASEVVLDGATATMSGNLVTLHNVKILSDTTDFDDYISIDYLFDVDSQGLIPAHLEIKENLGVFHKDEDLFSKDVGTDLVMTSPSGGTLTSDRLYSITASPNDEFTMYMEAGTVLTMQLKSPSDDYECVIERPDGTIREKSLYREGSWWYAFGRYILESGQYKFRFTPQNNNNVSLQFGFTNNNRKSLATAVSGTNISTSLSGWGYEYAKYQLALNRGDLLIVSDPSDDDVWLYLINSNGRQVNGSGGAELYQRISKPGDYYLFIVNKDHDRGSSYSGSVTIEADPQLAEYPDLIPISDQTASLENSFSLQLSASNNPTNYSATGLPGGLSIDSASGLISGTPTNSGKFPVTVGVENTYGSDSKDFLLTVTGLQDADGNDKVSLPDIIYGLQVLSGMRN